MLWKRKFTLRAMMFQVDKRISERAGRRTDLEPAAAIVSRGWWWWVLAAACLALAVWMMRTQAEVPVVRVALELEGGRDALKVRWREMGSGDAGRLESAALVVRQGREEETLDLSDRYVPEGGLAVQPRAQEIVVSLRVRRAGQPAIVRTVTYVDPGPAKGKVAGGELEWLRWRNRELEEKVAALQGLF